MIRQTAAQTGGRMLAFDLFLPPGGHVPAGHVHPVQEERFTVVAGRMRFRLGGRTILASPGETVRIPRGRRTGSETPGRTSRSAGWRSDRPCAWRSCCTAPGLLGVDGHFPGTHVPRLSDLALVLLEFQRELAVPNVPAVLVRAVMAPLAWLARRRTPSPSGRGVRTSMPPRSP